MPLSYSYTRARHRYRTFQWMDRSIRALFKVKLTRLVYIFVREGSTVQYQLERFYRVNPRLRETIRCPYILYLRRRLNSIFEDLSPPSRPQDFVCTINETVILFFDYPRFFDTCFKLYQWMHVPRLIREMREQPSTFFSVICFLFLSFNHPLAGSTLKATIYFNFVDNAVVVVPCPGESDVGIFYASLAYSQKVTLHSQYDDVPRVML